MLSCTEIEAQLSDYLDRDLPPASCDAIEAHLATCPRCQAATQALRQTVSICKQFRATDIPSALATPQKEELRAALAQALAAMRIGTAPKA